MLDPWKPLQDVMDQEFMLWQWEGWGGYASNKHEQQAPSWKRESIPVNYWWKQAELLRMR
jgi:hypothetical protein